MNFVCRHAKAQRALARFVMAHMALAALYHQLAGRGAEAQHAHLVRPLHLHSGDAALIAGGLRLFIGDEKAAAALDEAAARHELHAVAAAVLLHGAVDGDEINLLSWQARLLPHYVL